MSTKACGCRYFGEGDITLCEFHDAIESLRRAERERDEARAQYGAELTFLRERVPELEAMVQSADRRIAELEKHRDALVTGAFSAQNILTPEVLEKALTAYCRGAIIHRMPKDSVRAVLLAVGFVEPEAGDQREPPK